jgi:hypothetical protein
VTDIVDVDDLPTALQTAELVELMVAGANAKASRVAPCLTWTGTPDTEPAPSADQLAEAKLVLVGAIKRWSEASSGALQAQQAGPFGQTIDTRQRTGYNLWPSEIESLQSICALGRASGGAFSITPTPSAANHAPWCDLMFGGSTCSCGYALSGGDWIYEPVD